MKILYFTKYSRLGASSRLRSYQYFPQLEEQGFKITAKPLFEDLYLKKLYSGQSTKAEVVKSYLKRFFSLFAVFSYDLVVIEKELFPYIPPFFEWILKSLKIKYIVDYDDAIFHNYDLSNSFLIKFFLKNKIKYVMKYAYLVTAGNSYLTSFAQQAGARKISIIPTVINVNNYKPKSPAQSSPIIIGWIGSPSTLKYLKSLYPILKQLCDRYPVKVHVIGGKSGIGLGENEEIIEWSEDIEGDLIKACDIGIMPLEDSPWERGKCGYKLIQYMGCSLPIIASPVGVNTEIVKDGWNGFLAMNDQEWLDKLLFYINNEETRYIHGARGRAIVEEKYNLNLTSKQLISIMSNG